MTERIKVELRYCNHCGDDVDCLTTEFHGTIDGDVCENCFSEQYVSCVNCSDNMDVTSDYCYESQSSNEYYCEDCYQETFLHCDSCSNEIHYDEACYDEDGDYPYCEYCYHSREVDLPNWEVWEKERVETESTFISPEKNFYTYDDDGNLTRDKNIGLDVLRDFQSATGNKFKDSFKIIKSKRYVGSEIEFNHSGISGRDIHDEISGRLCKNNRLHNGGNDYHTGHVEHDGSITSEEYPDGHEVVLRPRRGDIFYDDMKEITSAIKSDFIKGFLSSRCGYHIHIDTRDFDWIHCAVLTAIVKMSEPHIYAMLPSSRRQGRWSYPVSQGWKHFLNIRDRDDFIRFWYDNGNYSNDKYNDKRYHGLNFHPKFQAKGGVEIRYHSGTLNPTKMLHWNILWTQIFDTARRIGDRIMDGQTYDEFTDDYISFIHSIRRKPDIPIDVIEKAKEIYNSDLQKHQPNSFMNIDEYRGTSRRLMKALSIDESDDLLLVPQAVVNLGLVGGFMSYDNPCISASSLYKMIDLPTDTIEHFQERFEEVNRSPETSRNHLHECFYRVNRVIEYDDELNNFGTIDYLLHRLPRVSDVKEDSNVSLSTEYFKPLDMNYMNRYLGT